MVAALKEAYFRPPIFFEASFATRKIRVDRIQFPGETRLRWRSYRTRVRKWNEIIISRITQLHTNLITQFYYDSYLHCEISCISALLFRKQIHRNLLSDASLRSIGRWLPPRHVNTFEGFYLVWFQSIIAVRVRTLNCEKFKWNNSINSRLWSKSNNRQKYVSLTIFIQQGLWQLYAKNNNNWY